MTGQQHSSSSPQAEPKCRPVGGTEYSWCKAVPGGTGITVLALLLSKPLGTSFLQNALHKLCNAHPILHSKLRRNAAANSFSFVTPSTPHLRIETFDFPSTSQILENVAIIPGNSDVSHFQHILEHELNRNSWTYSDPEIDAVTDSDINLLLVSVYSLNDEKQVLVLRLHTSVCDLTSAATLLREMLEAVGDLIDGKGTEKELPEEVEVGLGIEDYIPNGKANKPFWARGVDMLGYSLNSFRLANLNFADADSPRSSQVVRLRIHSDATNRILSGCESRGIKLSGALAAAGLIAARASKGFPEEQWEKYAVVTLIDCRSILDPVLSSDRIGFYHSAILNTHDIKGDEELWELAKKTYTPFANAKANNKHFTDMSDLNFLMCKAIDNPGLTPSSSLRTSLLSVFEEHVVDQSDDRLLRFVGVEDYIGCASTHGVGPSIAMFATIRGGDLDCACVYPSPLHSRQQMEQLVGHIKTILVDASSSS